MQYILNSIANNGNFPKELHDVDDNIQEIKKLHNTNFKSMFFDNVTYKEIPHACSIVLYDFLPCSETNSRGGCALVRK